MHSLTFYPLGNADSVLIELDAGRLLLFDYAQMRDAANTADKRIDLASTLRQRLADVGRTDVDVLAFTHLDDDHIRGASDVFWLKHSAAYQGHGRIRIGELWVPAGVITEDRHELSDEALRIQREARHRLRTGVGIRVFSRPDALAAWLQGQGLRLADRATLITDAGTLVPGFDKSRDGVEFFVHSPFAARHDNDLFDRNTCSLVLQATFLLGGQETHLILSADSPAEMLDELVAVTQAHGHQDRLAWDIFKLPHHCSYLSLSNEKGRDETTPLPRIAWLFEDQAANDSIIISTSDPIPAGDTDQPPHRQAANYYKRVSKGEFKVTMEHPTTRNPEPLVITIGSAGPTLTKRIAASSLVITRQAAPRAG